VAHRPRRAFLGLTEVAGYFSALAQGLEANGVRCLFVDESPDPFGYRRAGPLKAFARLYAATAAKAEQRGQWHHPWLAAVVVLRGVRVGVRVGLLLVAIATCDVFFFSAGDGFFRGRELGLLRALGKQIVWVFTGSDHRPPYLNGRSVRAAEAGGSLGYQHLAAEAKRIRERVTRAERYATVIVAHPASAQFHHRPFLQFLAVGVPFPTPLPVVRPRSAVVSIVHSPSDPVSKGTAHIRDSIQALRAQGFPIEYQELIGRPHDEVLAALARSNLVVDELYSDTPMGMLGTEAASVGTPTVSSGYYAGLVAATLPQEAIPPSAFVQPDELGAMVEALVREPHRRQELGDAAQAFVSSRWQPQQVAARYLRVLEGDTPDGWVVDPADVQYLGGWGMSAKDRRQAIRRLVALAGPSALCLDDSPALRDALLEDAIE
jgi:hypothetical protein